MSKTTELLEAAVADVIANRPAEGERPTARQRARVDAAFARVLTLVAPRIRHFIKQYGLTGHWEDAEQVCAIGIHRAIEAYDPAKAMFTTFVNWQIRGELQGLRFRLMDDQRPSARKVNATTISLQGKDIDGSEDSLEAMLIDEESLARTESAASTHLADMTSQALLDEYVRHLRSVGMAQLKRKAQNGRSVRRQKAGDDRLPKYVHRRTAQIEPEELEKLEERIARDREIVATYLMGDQPEPDDQHQTDGLTRERIRQITRRATRVIAELASDNPRFQAWRAQLREEIVGAGQSLPLLPAAGELHNRMVNVSAPDDEDDLSGLTAPERSSDLRLGRMH